MFLLLITTLFCVWLFHHLYWKRRNYPPGPIPLPFVGNFYYLYFYRPGHTAFKAIREKYGSIYTFWIGSQPVVMVTEYEDMKEIFIKNSDCFSDRDAVGEFSKLMRGGVYGIVDTNDEMWRTHRRFALHILRDLGVGGHIAEEHIIAEIQSLFKDLENKSSVNLKTHIQKAVASAINVFLFGYRFTEENRDELVELLGYIEKQKQGNANILSFLTVSLPWIRHLPIFKENFERIMDFSKSFFRLFGKQIENHQREIDYNSDEVKDYVEAYLKEQKKRESEGDTETYNHQQLLNVCFDLWLAGFDTTYTTLQWSLIYLSNNPDVQNRMREELATVLDKDELVTMRHKVDLPYCQAVVNECQRFLNLLIMNLLRKSKKEFVYKGITIPAGVSITAQICTALYDDKSFPDPLQFKPERFIDENGKLKKFDEFVPFSLGRRQCLGESLARMELFLFIVNFIHKYELSGKDLPKCAETIVALINPPDAEFTITKV